MTLTLEDICQRLRKYAVRPTDALKDSYSDKLLSYKHAGFYWYDDVGIGCMITHRGQIWAPAQKVREAWLSYLALGLEED